MIGHHSSRDSYGGYCFINNAAVMTHMLCDQYQKVGLLDIDYHSGNGSMSIFYRNPRVYFASIHCDCELDYPYNCGFPDQTGADEGIGTTLNYPLGKDAGWKEYEVALSKCLQEMSDFGVEALVVSLGVDTVNGDPESSPLGGFQLQLPDYVNIGKMIRNLNVPTIWVQEGGYRLDIAGAAVRHVLVPTQAK